MSTTTTLARSAVAMGATALLAFGSSPALAASSGGATHSDYSECDVFRTGTACFSLTGEANYVNTPSGNVIIQENFTVVTSFTHSGNTNSDTTSTKEQTLIKSGDTFMDHLQLQETILAPLAGVNCTYSVDYHYANGAEQFDNFNVTCI